MYINFSQISGLPSNIEIVVRSHGYFLYTLEFVHNDRVLFYTLDGTAPHRFRNLMSVKETLAPFPIRQAWLIHQSAYDEMVGQPEGGENELRVPLDLALPY